MTRIRNVKQRPLRAVFAAAFLSGAWMTAAAADHPVTYSEDILPIIKVRCLECHQPGGSGYEKSGLDMRTYESLMKGTKYGPIVVPGDAFSSNLNVLVEGRAASKIRMPHNRKKLTRCEIDSFRRWVNLGAKNN